MVLSFLDLQSDYLGNNKNFKKCNWLIIKKNIFITKYNLRSISIDTTEPKKNLFRFVRKSNPVSMPPQVRASVSLTFGLLVLEEFEAVA